MRRLRYTAALATVALAGAALTAGAASAGAAGAPAGEAPALPPGARVAGPESSSATLHVTVALRSADPSGLNLLATHVSTPGSPQFRHFLSPAQVQERFGPPAGAAASVRAWLRSQHLSTGPALGDGLLIPATGSTAQVEAAFQTTIEQVRLANGQMARVNRQAPKVPAKLRPSVATVAGLDNLNAPQPGLVRGTGPGPQACPAARNTPHVYTAAQLAHAYDFTPLYRQGDFGQHVTIALFELANYATKDVSTYNRCYGIHPAIRRVRIDGGTTIKASGQGIGEVTADIEVAGVMAPRARILVYEAPASGGDASSLDNYGAIVQQNRAQVVSTSWGNCEPIQSAQVLTVESQLFQAMAVQGQSMMAAAGDSGSEDCLENLRQVPAHLAYSLQVDDPGSQPFVTSVGGTAITRYGSPPVESAWNQTPGGQGFRAPFRGRHGHRPKYPGNLVGGGGISRRWLMPPWQAGIASANSSGTRCGAPTGTACREVPDVSALAAIGTRHTRGYVIYGSAGAFRGRGWQTVGGTSLATPLWAALTALADQQMVTHRLGLLSPSLYPIARQDPRAFTDVALGQNDYLAAGGHPSHYVCRYQGVPGQPCYRAVRGYDMATGLGTPRARYLIADLLG